MIAELSRAITVVQFGEDQLLVACTRGGANLYSSLWDFILVLVSLFHFILVLVSVLVCWHQLKTSGTPYGGGGGGGGYALIPQVIAMSLPLMTRDGSRVVETLNSLFSLVSLVRSLTSWSPISLNYLKLSLVSYTTLYQESEAVIEHSLSLYFLWIMVALVRAFVTFIIIYWYDRYQNQIIRFFYCIFWNES